VVVDEHDVGALVAGDPPLVRVAGARRGAGGLDAGLVGEHLEQAGAHGGMVVDDEDADRGGHDDRVSGRPRSDHRVNPVSARVRARRSRAGSRSA
jgi:hypothetical protein